MRSSEAEAKALHQRKDERSLLAKGLLKSATPYRAVVTCPGKHGDRHSLAKVYDLGAGRVVLAVPEIRIQHAFLSEDIPESDSSEAILVPWVYELSPEEDERQVYFRCRCSTWGSKLGRLREHLAMLPPGERRLMANWVGGANRARRDAPT